MRRRRRIPLFVLWAALSGFVVERAWYYLNREQPWVPFYYPPSRAWKGSP